jgi:stress-induced morphogen
METFLGRKGTTILYCEKCDYTCFHQSKYERHLGTAKHRRKQMETNQVECKIQCECGKEYSNRSGLFKHKKKCNYKPPEEILKNEMKEILKEQQEEQRKLLIEQQEQHKQQIEVLTEKISGMSLVTNHNTINNTTNNNTNTFNLKFFLNTQCKDAIDFNSFLRSIKVDDHDLKKFEDNGYIAGMMNVLERNLYSMKVEDRPIHCTDKKRKTIYYKKENGDWEKDEKKKKMPILIDHIENVSHNYFEKVYQESGGHGDNDTESPRYKWYIKMTLATTGGDYGSSIINHTHIMGMLTEEIYVKVVKNDKLKV